MRSLLRTWLVLGLLAVIAAPATPSGPAKKLKVVTTIPDLADFARQIGGERVEVQSICRGLENLHFVNIRPSHLVAVTRADVFIQVGLSLEVGFVPGLLRSARNMKIMPPDGVGFINASQGWKAIQIPPSMNRAQGDVHPEGNPHMNLDPESGRYMAERILAGLIRVDPESKGYYEERFAAYQKKLDAAEKRWAEIGKSWEGKKVVQYHVEHSYLLQHYGMEQLIALEPKPGIPPSPRHLATVISKIRAESGDALIAVHWSNNKNVKRVVQETDIPLVELPNMCNPKAGTGSWIEMMDFVHERLGAAFEAK